MSQFLSSSAKLRKASISFIMFALLSVRPSVIAEHLYTHWTDFHSILYLTISTCFGGLWAHHQEINCVYATLGTCYSVWMTVWYTRCTLHTRHSSIQNNKYQVLHKHSLSPDDGLIVPRNMQRSSNIKYTKKKSAPSCFCLQDHTEMRGLKNIKKIV
jgi:hypothetical protein